VAEHTGPSAAAAEKHGGPEPGPPPHPPVEASADTALSAVLDATRALLWIRTPADAAAVACDLVEILGGRVVPAHPSTGDAIPVDVSFGEGEPVLPGAPRTEGARMLLERHLPAFVRDAHRALELANHPSRLAEDAAVDPLTGRANRRALGRALGRLQPEDTVIMIDLDHFKAVNDSFGHHEGDRVLRLFGLMLASTLRATERGGRYGGDEFVVILAEGGTERFLTRLRTAWMKTRPHPVTFSAGVASARADPRKVLKAADRAMYRAKQPGGNRSEWATKEDYL
jgi:diguanylate cyclase (GGDEF)-like protein